MTEDSGPELIESTRRSFDIVETLRDLDGARLTEVAAACDLPNSTVYNHLATLIECGYVVREDDTYRLSLRFLRLGEYTRGRLKLYDVGRSEAGNVAEATGEVASIIVEESGFGVHICSIDGPNSVPLDTRVGKRVRLHATAPGKCILAGLPDERVEEILDSNELVAYTENTITDRGALSAEIATVRERGIAYDWEEQVNGIARIAAPVRTETGKVLGALGISGPIQRFSDAEVMAEYVESLHEATNIIELKLAYS